MRQISIAAGNQGEAMRLHHTCQVMARLLAHDPRVLKLYGLWLKETGFEAELDALSDSDDDVVRTQWLRAAEAPKRKDKARTGKAVRGHQVVTARMESLLQTIDLPYPWLAAVLMESFVVRMSAAASRMRATLEMPLVLPVVNFTMNLEVDGFPRKQIKGSRTTLPRGRVPSEKGLATLARNVDWLYRARIKDPPETIYGISKHDGAGRSVVQGGIESARDLLRQTLTPMPE